MRFGVRVLAAASRGSAEHANELATQRTPCASADPRNIKTRMHWVTLQAKGTPN